MHTMNLILQGLTTDPSTIERIATSAGATSLTAIHAHAYCCHGVRPSSALKTALGTACQAAQLDVAFMLPERALSDFKLVAMDMDSTLITIECIDEIADMQGLKPQVASITEAAMRGEIGFRDSLLRRVALLQGLEANALQRVLDERLQLSPGAETMLAAMQAAGLCTLLVSGGFTFFTDYLKQRLGLNHTCANVLEIVDGKLTGRIASDIVDADAKKRAVEHTCTQMGISPQQAIVIGDGANDLAMMRIAGLSVAFRAKPIVRSQADVALNYVGLDGILNLFGGLSNHTKQS